MGKLKDRTVMAVYVLLGVTGMLFAFSDTFELEYEKMKVWLVTACFCIAVTVILSGKKKRDRLAAAVLTLCGAGAAAVLSGGKGVESLRYIAAAVSAQTEAYMEAVIADITYTGAEHADRGLLVLFFLLAGLFAYGVVCVKQMWVEGILLGIGFVLPFCFGKTPGSLTLVLIICEVTGLAAYKSGIRFQREGTQKRKTGLAGVGLAAAAFSLGILFPGPQLRQAFQNQATVQKEVQNFWEENLINLLRGKGGVNSGRIGRVGKFGDDDSEQLVLTAKERPSDEIYLKGYVGVEYTGDRWKKADADAFAKWARAKKTSAQEVLNREVPEFPQIKAVTALHVKNIGADKTYYYMPYGGFYDKNLRTHGDTYIYADGKKEYDVQEFDWMQVWDNEKTLSSTEQAYLEYVQKTYLGVPKQIEKSFRDVVEEEFWTDDPLKVRELAAQLLAREAEYSLEPGKTPDGKDVVEYFFFENKKGYCEHFASTAVLLLRMKGIPARYVSGYKVRAGEFRKMKDGTYECTVTGDSAHAWAEIYLPEVGWMPVEATPFYSAADVSTPQVPQTPDVQEENAAEQTPDVPEETQTKQTEKADAPQEMDAGTLGNKDGGKDVEPHVEKRTIRLWEGCLAVAAVILALVLAGVFRRRRQKPEERSGDINERTKILFRKMYRILVREKAVKAEEASDEEVIRALCGLCPKVTEEEAGQMLETVYRASFGKEKISREEYRMCLKIYGEMRRK